MFLLSVVVSFFLVFTAATNVSQCPGKSFDKLKENVQLMPCKKLPCHLKKGTATNITMRFKPETDMDSVTNHVTAELLGIPFPFVGVDGMSVCGKFETENGEKTPCPLKAGNEYVYRDSFQVLEIYPSVKAKVHWALQHGGKDIICFEVPVNIQ